MDRWAYEQKVELVFSRPGKPTDNAYIESFNGSFRDECLNTNWFLSLEDTKQKIEDWRREYNTFRPHSCLVDLTPEMFIENQVKTANFSTLNAPEIGRRSIIKCNKCKNFIQGINKQTNK